MKNVPLIRLIMDEFLTMAVTKVQCLSNVIKSYEKKETNFLLQSHRYNPLISTFEVYQLKYTLGEPSYMYFRIHFQFLILILKDTRRR